MLLLYKQRGSLLSAASGRGPYYNFPKLHWHSNSSEAVHVQEHNKIVTRDKVSDVLNCNDAWSNLFRNHHPNSGSGQFFPSHWDDWYQAIIGHIWTFSFILVEWSNSWAFHSSANIFFLIDKLNRHDNDSEIKSRHSLRSLPEILSRPVAFDLQSLDVLFCLQVGELIRGSLRVD